MSIELHCEHCGKLVRAPDEAAGKRGVCPACHQSVYIPTPADRLEPLDLAPVDKDEERERERLLHESQELTKRLLSEEGIPDRMTRSPAAASGSRQASGSRPASGAAKPAPKPVDMRKLLIQWVRAMADGELAVAERLAEHIRRDMSAAEDAMQAITMDELLPTELTDIPRPVLVGFFKQLRGG